MSRCPLVSAVTMRIFIMFCAFRADGKQRVERAKSVLFNVLEKISAKQTPVPCEELLLPADHPAVTKLDSIKAGSRSFSTLDNLFTQFHSYIYNWAAAEG
eukprot:1455615-Amphidinium_carterae.3